MRDPPNDHVQLIKSHVGLRGTQIVYTSILAASDTSGTYYTLNAAPAAVTATGLTVYELYPGDGAAGAGVTQRTNAPLPRTWRVNVAHGDGSSYTYSVGYSLIQ